MRDREALWRVCLHTRRSVGGLEAWVPPSPLHPGEMLQPDQGRDRTGARVRWDTHLSCQPWDKGAAAAPSHPTPPLLSVPARAGHRGSTGLQANLPEGIPLPLPTPRPPGYTGGGAWEG